MRHTLLTNFSHVDGMFSTYMVACAAQISDARSAKM